MCYNGFVSATESVLLKKIKELEYQRYKLAKSGKWEEMEVLDIILDLQEAALDEVSKHRDLVI